MFKVLFFIAFIILISSSAIWLSNSKGKLVIEWLGWQITTTPAFFLISLLTFIFLLYVVFSLIFFFINIPKHTINNINKKRINKANLALHNGIIASFYGNKLEALKNMILAKKYLKNEPLLLLLEFQNSVYKGNRKNSFYVLTKMLEIDVLKPLAIKGLIRYSKKNKDRDLFKNILNKSLNKKVDFSWIEKDIYEFCIENNYWQTLSSYLEKKLSLKIKKNKEIISVVYYQIALNYYASKELSNAKIYLKKALKNNKNFPPFMELYCKLKIVKSDKELINFLKSYWLQNPNPNIEQCVNISFSNQDELSKVKTLSKILVKNDDLYYKHLILGKFKYKAKVWGSSKNDLNKSLKFRPSKEAYYYLSKIEEDLKNVKSTKEKLKKMYDNCEKIYLWKCYTCNLLHERWLPYCSSCKKLDSIKIIDYKTVNNRPKLLINQISQ